MHTLELPLKAQWYDMIESGIKKEEYRELKPYWLKRMCLNWQSGDRYADCMQGTTLCRECLKNEYLAYPFDAVRFRYGYTRRTMLWSIDGISIGRGRTEWGAPEDEEVFIIKLKERIE